MGRRNESGITTGHKNRPGWPKVRRNPLFPYPPAAGVSGVNEKRVISRPPIPELLLTALRNYPIAVVIARGDLAVEAGWERLAEIQEEILWLCEAARIPVIRATQVLERTAERGQPSRAEISDAALSNALIA